MNATETATWILSWWQNNGLLAQGQEMIDGVSLFVKPCLIQDGIEVVRVSMRVELPPDLSNSCLEEFDFRPAGDNLDRAGREQEEREIVSSLHGAMKRLRARIEDAAIRQIAEIGPVGAGPGMTRL